MSDFPKKWADKLPPDFKDSADSMSEDELRRKVVEFEIGVSFTEAEKSKDPLLCSLKEQVKEADKDYRADLNRLNACIKYAVFILESRGVGVTPPAAQTPVTPPVKKP